jgi:predicted protein tyrosine phosphatase
MITSVDFWSRNQVNDYLFNDNDIVISITNPKQHSALISQAADVLHLQFQDMDLEMCELVTEMDTDTDFGIFTKEKAQAVMTFIELYHKAEKSYRVIVHCDAGIARSPAIALYVAAATKCEFSNQSYTARANEWVIKLLSKMSGLSIGRNNLKHASL